MPTDKQRKDIEALLAKTKKVRPRNRIYGFSEEECADHGGVDYLSDRELAEVKERLEHGGYNHIA